MKLPPILAQIRDEGMTLLAAEYDKGVAAERTRYLALIQKYAEGCSDGPHRDVAFYLAEMIERSALAEAAE